MGWTYNTENPDAATNGPTIAAVGITFTTLSFLIVALRVYVRGWMIKAVGADDWIMIFTWFMSLGFLIVTLLQTRWGLGLQNASDMPEMNVFTFGLIQFCGAPFYISSIFGFKLSLLVSFLRIAVEKRYRMAIIAITIACTVFHLIFLLVQINVCSPVAAQWDNSITGAKCLSSVPFYTSMASITIVFDVIIMLAPFPMLIETKIPLRKKIILLGMFSLGTFITIIQIIRILTIKSFGNHIDSSELIMWSTIENNLGIIVASLPPLTPLFKSLRNRSTYKSDSGGLGMATGSGYVLQSRSGMMALGSYNDQLEGKGTKDQIVRLGDMESSTEELSTDKIYKTTEFVIHRTSAEDEETRGGKGQQHGGK